MRQLETKIPPVIVFIISAIMIWLIAGRPGATEMEFSIFSGSALLLVLIGITIAITAVFSFRKNQTTVDPINPEKAEKLVTEGIYQYTRNPMYLGLALILTALSVLLKSPFSLAGVLLFMIYLTRFQIHPEERAMIYHFGDEYKKYMCRVRRWL